MRSRVHETVERPDVRPSVCLSHRSTAAADLLPIPRVKEISINSRHWRCAENQSCQFYAAFLDKYADRINTKYSAEICGNVVQNCLKPTTSSRYTRVRSGHMDSVGNQMVEVTKSNSSRNTNNMKIAVENAYICVKKYGTCTLC